MLIVGNWKAYVTSVEKAKKLFASAKRLASPKMHIVLAVPEPYIGMLAQGNRSKVAIGAQDISLSMGGATTGETPATLLQDLKVKYAIIGHSERRAMGETDAMVSEKAQRALAHAITPVVCVGERERDTDAQYLKFIRAQIAAIYEPLSPKDRAHIVLAYEPIWAIGAAQAITPGDLQEMVLYIRKVLAEYVGDMKISLIYGGSVDPDNIRALADAGVDGFLPGRASTDPATFSALIQALR